jgi:hypothetical protein
MDIFAKITSKLSRKIKLIWDFRGPEALEIAKHHVIHLEEFAVKDKLFFYETGITPVNELYCIAYITVKEEDMITYRDALLPHRGEVAK